MAKIRFTLDPSKSDAELAKAILEIARENFDLDEEEEEVAKHGGPGPHPGTGTEQTVHGSGGGGASLEQRLWEAEDEASRKEQMWLEDQAANGLADEDYYEWSKDYDLNQGYRGRDNWVDMAQVSEDNWRQKVELPERPGIDDNTEAVKLAEKKWYESYQAEADVSPVMRKVAAETGGTLEGSEYRIKTERSLRRKIVQDAHELGISLDEAAANVRDGLRYTVSWEADDQFFPKADKLLDSLKSEGWEIYDHKNKNFFAPGDHYDGVNLQLTDGTSFFEVQLHTPGSLQLKERSHELLDQLRLDLPEEKREEITEEMYDLWNSSTDHRPPGHETWGTRSNINVGKAAILKAGVDYYIYTADGETPLALFRATGARIERFESGSWVESSYTLPDLQGLGGSADFERVADSAALKLIVDLPKKKEPTDFSTDIKVAKSDDYKNLVFGWASVAFSEDGTQILDHQGHAIDIEDLEDAAYNFTVKGYGTGDMHQSENFGELVESIVLTQEKAELMGIPPGTTPQGWWVGFRVPPEYHEQVRTGKRTMFSIEGTAKLEPYSD